MVAKPPYIKYKQIKLRPRFKYFTMLTIDIIRAIKYINKSGCRWWEFQNITGKTKHIS